MTADFNPITFDIPMPIRTPRLIIRPPQAGDGHMITDAKRESWAELARWMHWAQGEGPDMAADEAMVRTKAAEFMTRTDMQLNAHDPDTGQYVAGTGFHRYCWKARRFEIGYFVRTSRTGQGLAAEIATAMAHFAFAVLGANRLEIKMDRRNLASEAVAKRAGFIYESTAHHDAVGTDNQLRDTHTYVAFARDQLPPLAIRWGP